LRPNPPEANPEVSRARRYPAAAASLIMLGLLLLLAPKLVGSLFSAQWFGLPAGYVFVGLCWVALVGLSWLAQHALAPLILDREGVSEASVSNPAAPTEADGNPHDA